MPPPTLRALAAALLRPARPDERAAVARAAARLPESVARAPAQTLGRWTAGCAATRGVHEACDLCCVACYRSPAAESTPPLPRSEVEAQLDTIRAQLGPGGHVQLTAGEVTLLPDGELVALVRAARARELVPMLMTNGVGLLDDPERLVRLVREGGLRHLAVHVDATQRGRRGWAPGQSEASWNAERERVARMVREVRARTGVRLSVAHTVTLTDASLDALPELVRFVRDRADAFFMLSVQPAARVGTTRRVRGPGADDAEHDPGDDPGHDDVWRAVQRGVGHAVRADDWLYGHGACSQVTPLLAVRADERVTCVPLVRPGSSWDRRVVRRLLGSGLAGWTRHGEHAALSTARLLGRLARHPLLVLELSAWGLLRGLALSPSLARVAWARLRGRRAWLAPFTVVVHRFMEAAELDTPLGRERLESCAFRVPVEGVMIPMCALNATDLRRQLDVADRQRLAPPRSPVEAPTP